MFWGKLSLVDVLKHNGISTVGATAVALGYPIDVTLVYRGNDGRQRDWRQRATAYVELQAPLQDKAEMPIQVFYNIAKSVSGRIRELKDYSFDKNWPVEDSWRSIEDHYRR